MRKATVLVAGASLLMLLFSTGGAGARQKEETSDPEMFVKSSKFLEVKPLDKEAKGVRAWALKWLIATDKVSVTVCPLLISGIDDKYKYSGEIFGQYTIGMAAFKLSNPTEAKDEDAVQFAGIQSALTTYTSILAEKPKAKNAFLDDLLIKHAHGELTKLIAEQNCKEHK